MDSKAIAVVIIGVGIMVLIVSAAIGAPTDGMVHTFSGWPAQADILPAVPMAAAARALPLVETQTRPESEDLACTVAVELKVPAAPEPAYCVFVGGADRKWQCESKFIRHCIDDYPSTEEPPAIQDVRAEAKSLVR